MRIDAFERGTEASDWLELSENRRARANTNLVAAERICGGEAANEGNTF